MIKLILLILISLNLQAKEATKDKNFHFISPFSPTIKGNYCLPNLHQVDKEAYVYRSMAPYKDKYISELQKLGIKKVLIFKDHVDHFMKKEIKQLNQLNIKYELIKFPYQNIKSFKPVCLKTIKALKLLKSAIENKTKLLFHCTVGEDRTGYLSGLFNIMMYKTEPNIIFQQKLCKKGYGKGNPEKPFKKVVVPIRKALTPLFSKMAFLLMENHYSIEEFEAKKLCSTSNFKTKKYSAFTKKYYKDFFCINQKISNWSCTK